MQGTIVESILIQDRIIFPIHWILQYWVFFLLGLSYGLFLAELTLFWGVWTPVIAKLTYFWIF